MLRNRLVLSLILASFAAHSHADTKEASVSPRWLRLYQYQKKSSGYVSDVTSDRFFFSPDGRRNPTHEFEAAVHAYEDPSLKFGTQKDSAACVFPYRKKVLEQLTGRSFPSPRCSDLENWVSRIGADRINLVFVGAYPGNPASILGHSFIRLSNSKREGSGREGLDLLSYSIGFLAQSDPGDNRMTYMLKGLTGGYPGFYEIEPHYMKVGLYNNSESRDLWELPLSLSKQEVDDLIRHYWELTFNASFDYYFIDENCSYRLLTLIEAVKPEVDLTSRLSIVVLPAETVRATLEAGIANGEPTFRPSVKRRMNYKLSLLDSTALASFDRARTSLEETKKLEDPTAVDALLDHWLYQNYKVKTNLDERSKSLMEATFARASELRAPSRFIGVTNEMIREKAGLIPPYFGHRVAWLEMRGGVVSDDHATGAISFRSGVHPFWSSDRGYDEITAIEYLGFDLAIADREKPRWSLLLAKATSFENFFSFDRSMSWSFEGLAESDCAICGTTVSVTRVDGGYGLGFRNEAITAAVLAGIRAATWLENGAQGVLAPGLSFNLKLRRGNKTVSYEPKIHWWRERHAIESSSRASWSYSTNSTVFIQTTREATESSWRVDVTGGFVHYF